MSNLGPLNGMFSTDAVTFTSPNGEVIPVKSHRVAKENPRKIQARKALDEAREALRVAEENYRVASKTDEADRIKVLDDFYRGKLILEYDRVSKMMGEGPIVKENFTITRVEKVVGVGNGFMSITGKCIKVEGIDRYGGIDNRECVCLYVSKGEYLKIGRIDRLLTEKQLKNILGKVRKSFDNKVNSIW